jgi:8-oxo-dGTP pyrophosphatase MutT (NUDIX family)
MKISCGFIITYKNTLLLGRVTNHSFWDIPKGMKEPDEDYLEAALRELREETSIRLTGNENIKTIGFREYERNKKLYLFKYKAPRQYSNLHCNSMVEYDPIRGKENDIDYFEPFPEIDKFEWVDFNSVMEYTLPSLYRAISPFIED